MSEERKADTAMIEGSPEYKAAYEKAYAQLENPEPEAKEPEVKEPEQKPEVEEEPKAETPKDQPAENPLELKVKELEERLSSTGKALKDTQAWGHKLSSELKTVRKGLQEATTPKPELLKELPGLEEAIRHVATPKQEDDTDLDPPKPENTWVEVVGTALPDLDNLLADETFSSKAKELRAKHANEWGNPIKAIQHLSALRQDHITQKAVDAAVKAHSAKLEQTQRKITGMDVPGDTGKSAGRGNAADLRNDSQAVWNMTPDQFAKLKAKTLGY